MKPNLIIFALVFMLCGCLPEAKTSQQPQENQVQTPTSQETIPESTPAQPEKPTIPGIAAVDVYGNLENSGFQCDDPKSVGELMEWRCQETTDEHEYLVEILGASPTEIEVIKATSLNYSNQDSDAVAQPFLGFVATVPYEGANPEAARAWVTQSISESEAEEIFGSVKIQIFGDARARILRITPSETP